MRSRLILPLLLLFLLGACGGNLFTVEDDKALGEQVDGEIESDSATYPILDEAAFPGAYAYLRGIRDKILASGHVAFADEFVWEMHIIEDDEVLNAFATPGGYLYFYTGLIKFLDSEDHFAGVLGHEMAHAAERHTTDALTRQFGVAILLEVAFGGNLGILADIANGLGELAFSRSAESEADARAVLYHSETEYACDGVAGFFQKLVDAGAAGGGPEFLSTHPNPDNRVEDIAAEVAKLGCDTTPSGNDYQSFIDLLP